MGQNAYFVAEDEDFVYGEELWTTDGTAGGAHMVKDIYSGSDSSSISEITAVDGILYLNATDETENGYNTDLWRSDGTEEGTFMLVNLNPYFEEGSYPENLTKVGKMLFFSAWTNEYGMELYSLSTAVELSTDSSLSALTVSECSLSPVFDTAETSYTCTVPQSVWSVNVVATTTFVNATLTVDGRTITSGSPLRVNLMPGVNEIPVIVTAENGIATTTYTIFITRSAQMEHHFTYMIPHWILGVAMYWKNPIYLRLIRIIILL
jgi:ELWxxDGT repeat protein